MAISSGPLLSGSAAAADVDNSANQLPEVIVTAQKRSEDLTKVPSSISVLNGDALGAGGIKDFDDLSRAVPGLSVSAGTSEGTANLQIRGVSASGGDSTVSVYLNETPITVSSRFGGATQPIPFDIGQVEILRGPQGTLYGASALGGTIRYIQNKPNLNSYSGFAAADLSGTEHGGINYETSALVNIPVVAGKFAVRIGGLYGSDSGWIDNYNLYGQIQNPGTNSDKKKLLRVAALYEPTDDLSISSNITYQRFDQKDTSAFYTSQGVANSFANSLSSGASPYTLTDGLFKESKTIREWSHDSVLVADLGVNKDLGFATITSDSSYFYRSFNQLFDGTYYNSGALNSFYLPAGFNPSPLLAFSPSPSYQPVGWDTWTQEIRLTSPDNPPYPVKWVAGLYVTQQHVGYTQNELDPNINSIFQSVYGVPIGSISAALGGPANYNDFFNPIFSAAAHETDDQYAAFASATYDILPDLHLTAGIRYTISHSVNVADNLQTSFFDVGLPAEKKSSILSFSATPRFSLAYDINDNSSIYTTEAKGFRLGGPAGSLPTGPGNVCSQDYANLGVSAPPNAYGPDSLWSYEAGLKTKALDRTLSVNTAGYYIQWHNLQQGVNLPICGFGYTTNAGDAVIYGSELEVVYAPPMFKGLKLAATGSFNHAEITKTTAPFATVGEAVENVPERTGTFSADYEFPLIDSWAGFVHGDYNFNGHAHGQFQTYLPNFENHAYGVVNARLGVNDDVWSIYLYAKNLLNDHTIYQQPVESSVTEGYTVRPLTVGISARRDF
jgi:outer membrane receptor protein involved in Fe transport